MYAPSILCGSSDISPPTKSEKRRSIDPLSYSPDIVSLAGRLRKRPDGRPVYTVDGSDEDADFDLNKDPTTEQIEGLAERDAVTPLTEMEKILDCQMRSMASNDLNSSDNVVKQYLVKWKGLSYLHCSWVPAQEFQKAYKFNPRLVFRVIRFHSAMESMSKNGDDFVAIHPEWTTVDRVIDCRGEDGGKEYLVKFKELSYDECYWESESDISTFLNEIQRFKDINSGCRTDKYVGHERSHEDLKQFDHTPEFITGSLNPYQLSGLNFLRFTWSKRTLAVLDDEMGIGKTIQSIAFLASLFEENLAPYLVVAPVSTLRNWEREFATWAPHMNVVMYCGNSQARTVIRDHEFYFPKGHNKMIGINGESKQERMKFDVILTSYEMINVDTEILKPIKWKCMIVDEGHRLKNKNSELFNSLKPYTSEHRVLVRKNLDDESAVLEEAHAIENKSSTSNYLEDSLKDKYESQQVEELNVLGKRKRNHKQRFGEDALRYQEAEQTDGEAAGQGNQMAYWPYNRRNPDNELACLEATSAHEEPKPIDGEAARQGNQMAKRPYNRRTRDTSEPIPLIEGGGRYLKVLGFNELQRKRFIRTLERYGVGNYDWKEFVDPLKPRTYDEIKNYGLRFLKHIVEDKDVNSPTFSDINPMISTDGVPKEGLICHDLLAKIAVMMLIQKKVKLMKDHPTIPVFSDGIIHRFPALRFRRGIFSNDERDRILLRAVSKNGVGKWSVIVTDIEFGIDQLVRKELNRPYTSFITANGNVKETQIIVTDHIKRRFLILKEAIINEFAEEYYYGQKPSSLIRAQQNGLLDQPKNLFSDKFRLLTERALHKFARKNISRSLRGYDEEEEEEEVTEVIMMD
ncbi:hypothetical protein HID58_040561 [Brassica napus]|uniref:DNA helicase n=1 Tax=Brassica napus TaxID=3708 RepID=A0ABQ8B9D9_BRANA|nr:hypothetical protein HID58_040561 [Brassica napus]